MSGLDEETLQRLERSPLPFADASQFPWAEPGFAIAFLEASTRGPERTAAELQWLEERNVPTSGCRVLDLGCGAGRYGQALSQRGCRYVGVDISEEVLARARARDGSDSLAFVSADLFADDLPAAVVEGAPFDLILMGYGQLSSAPLPQQRRLLGRLAALLSGRGVIAAEMLPEGYLRALDGHRSWWVSDGPFPPGPSPQLVLEEVTVSDDLAYVHRLMLMGPNGQMRQMAQSARFHTAAGYEELFASAGLRLEHAGEVEPEELIGQVSLERLEEEPGHPDAAPGLWLIGRLP